MTTNPPVHFIAPADWREQLEDVADVAGQIHVLETWMAPVGEDVVERAARNLYGDGWDELGEDGPIQSAWRQAAQRLADAGLLHSEAETAEEVERLRARTHEIQAEEMTKRAALDSEVAIWRQRYESAKRWTEDAGLRAEWAVDPGHPFWSMTSYNARSALMRLVAEREDALRALGKAGTE